eukprot:5307280-Pleurochrysis_carterae.AAC.1
MPSAVSGGRAVGSGVRGARVGTGGSRRRRGRRGVRQLAAARAGANRAPAGVEADQMGLVKG